MQKKKDIIKEFYQELYNKENVPGEEIKHYLEEANLPTVPEEERNKLNRRITETELLEAIRKQKGNKNPGPDGLPSEIYKCLQEVLSPILLEIYNAALEEAKIPQSWTEALISLIPKEGMDITHIKNYRPISLLNTDYKIYATIIANRLKNFLNTFIHTDQNGFLPGRQIKNNIRIILDTLEYYEFNPGKQMAMIFLDAQKAFDNLNWQFLFQQLNQMQFGEKLINTIRAIYTIQTAKVMINGETTENLKISRGTRQGCPLSPLLFILTLEVLTRKIRNDPEIRGLAIKREEFKLQAFADDLVFILEKPQETGLKLMLLIEKYGTVAGLKINREKTKMLVKNMTGKQKEELVKLINLQITNRIKYLGIQISARCKTIKEDNYDKVKMQIKSDLEKWKNLQLSLMGRVEAIKINVLPRLLYLFQVVPMQVGKSFFEDLNKLVVKFIWQGKKPRIRLKSLQDARERGGFGLPNWEVYYQASALGWIREWVNLTNKRLLTLEGFDLQLGWHFFLWYEKSKTHTYFRRHLVRDALISVWLKTRKKLYRKVPPWLSTLEAWSFPNVSNLDKIVRYKDLLNGMGELKTFQELKDVGIDLSWWVQNQIKSGYEKDKKEFGFSKKGNELDQILMGAEEKFVRKTYNYLLMIKTEKESIKNTMVMWSKNIGHEVELEEWQKLWSRNMKLVMSTSYKENIYKMMYRWHYTPTKLAKMDPSRSTLCWKCKKNQGTYFHMWWTCPKAKKYWKKIQKWLEAMLKCRIEIKPEIFLLGIFKENIKKSNMYLILHVLTAARITFAQCWKNDEIPTETQIIRKILECAEMVKLTLKIRGKEDGEYYQIWELFYAWLADRYRDIEIREIDK